MAFETHPTGACSKSYLCGMRGTVASQQLLNVTNSRENPGKIGGTSIIPFHKQLMILLLFLKIFAFRISIKWGSLVQLLVQTSHGFGLIDDLDSSVS